MEPRIETLREKRLIGRRIRMKLSENKTFELWHSFMIWRKEIKNCISTDLFSMQVYDKLLDFNNFSPDTEFEKWAATEVSDFDAIPDEMEPYLLKGGLYAVFNYKGTPDNFSDTFRYIFGTWLPGSCYLPDNREHFEILGENYQPDDSNSEEEIWVPIKPKG